MRADPNASAAEENKAAEAIQARIRGRNARMGKAFDDEGPHTRDPMKKYNPGDSGAGVGTPQAYSKNQIVPYDPTGASDEKASSPTRQGGAEVLAVEAMEEGAKETPQPRRVVEL